MACIAIIGGAGKMGQWLAGFLKADHHDIVIADRDKEALEIARRKLGVRAVASNTGAARGADYILLAVPIKAFEGAVEELGPHVQASQTVIDITSVKMKPVDLMHRFLKNGRILGAHPLFGPGATSISNKNCVLTPTTEAEAALARKVGSYLEKKGARVSIMTPATHDEMMSLVLGLSHFIALVTADTLLDAGELRPMAAAGSSTYKVLLTLIESVLSEDPELYASIQMNLPDVTRFESLFLEKASLWVGLVAAKDHDKFTRRMKAMKKKLAEVAPDFEKSYEKMYRIVEGL